MTDGRGHLIPDGAFGQIVHTMGVRSLTLLCRVALTVAVTRTLSPSDYGAYALIGTIGAFATVLAGLNLSAYVLRAVPGRSLSDHLAIFKTTYLFETGFAALAVVTLIASGQLPSILNLLSAEEYRGAFLIGFVLTVVLVSNTEITSYFLAQARVQRANWVDFFGQAIWILPLVGMYAARLRFSLTTLLIAQIAGGIIAAAYAASRIGFQDWWSVRPRRAILAAGLRFSVPLIVPAVAVNAVRFADRFMLSFYGSLADVGVYAFAAVWVNTLYSFTAGPIFSTFGPRIVAAHNRDDAARRDILQTYMLKYSLLGFVGAFAVFWSLAGPLFGILARPEYARATYVVPILGASSMVMIFGYPASYMLTVRDRVLLLAGIDVIGTALGLSANVFLIPRYGFVGAAMAGLLGLSTTATLQYLFSGMASRLRLDVLFSFREEIELVRRGALRILPSSATTSTQTTSGKHYD